MEEQVEGNGTSEYFRQITSTNCEFAQQPVGPASPPGVPVAAALGQILSRHYSQAGGNYLHEDSHQAGHSDHPQKSILEPSTALQVRPPVARVHVADTDENRWPDESSP